MMEKIKLVVTFDPRNRSVNVDGPLDDKMLCFGLLEMAKMIITTYKSTEQSNLIVPQMIPPVDLKGGN